MIGKIPTWWENSVLRNRNMIGKIPTWWENSVRERKKVFRCMDHLVLRHPSYMRGFTFPFSLSVYYCITPSLQLPTYYRSTAWPGRASIHENGQPLTTQSVRYHSLSSIISFRLQGSHMSATSQARLHGVLGRTSMYEMCLVPSDSLKFSRPRVLA